MSGYSPHSPSPKDNASAIKERYAAQLQRMEQRRREQEAQIHHQQTQIVAQQQYLDQQRQEVAYQPRLATPLASPNASQSMPTAMFNNPPTPRTDSYVPVFDSRRTLFGGSPRQTPASPDASISPMRLSSPPRQMQQAMSPARGVSPVAATYRPATPNSLAYGQPQPQPMYSDQQAQYHQQRPPSPSRDAVQQTVNDVASSRFAQFIPRSPHPASGQPVSVLAMDDHDVVAAIDPQQEQMSPYAASVLASPSFAQQQQPEIMAVLPSTRPSSATRMRDVAAGGHVYSFSREDQESSYMSTAPAVRMHTAPQAERFGLSSGIPSPVTNYTTATGMPLAPTPSNTGGYSGTTASVPDSTHTQATTHINVAPSTLFQSHVGYHDDLEAITFKIGGCWDLSPRFLLISHWVVLFLILLFTLISFGVSWSTGSKTDTTLELGGSMDFFIGHFEDNAGDPAYANVTVESYTRDYTSASDWRNQCKIDNYRVPICLGLSIPFLFLAAWAVWKRSHDHVVIKWRRSVIFFLVIYMAFILLADIQWWQGCGNFVQAAVYDSGQKVLADVHFTSGWWLTMLNVFLTFIIIFMQGMAYGEERCCVCSC